MKVTFETSSCVFMLLAYNRTKRHAMKKSLLLGLVTVLGFGHIISQKFEGIALTPPMGWNSWNKFQRDINEHLFRVIADAIVSTGMRDAGYTPKALKTIIQPCNVHMLVLTPVR